jgi:hypothetical protein
MHSHFKYKISAGIFYKNMIYFISKILERRGISLSNVILNFDLSHERIWNVRIPL